MKYRVRLRDLVSNRLSPSRGYINVVQGKGAMRVRVSNIYTNASCDRVAS